MSRPTFSSLLIPPCSGAVEGVDVDLAFVFVGVAVLWEDPMIYTKEECHERTEKEAREDEKEKRKKGKRVEGVRFLLL